MQHLEVTSAVRPLYASLVVKGLNIFFNTDWAKKNVYPL